MKITCKPVMKPRPPVKVIMELTESEFNYLRFLVGNSPYNSGDDYNVSATAMCEIMNVTRDKLSGDTFYDTLFDE